VTALALRARIRRRRLLEGRAGSPRWQRLVGRRPRVVTGVAAGVAGVLAWLPGGAVGAVIASAYAWLGVAGLLRYRSARVATEAAARALDATATLAADLRAGGSPDGAVRAALPALAAPEGGAEVERLARQVSTALAVSATTGAPLADLLDRLAADASSRARVRQAASAQAAGATATAWLLAGLPVAGIAVGYGMGADPLRVLLHTRVGVGCALLALVLQVAGLAWSRRLARIDNGSPGRRVVPSRQRGPAGAIRRRDVAVRWIVAALAGVAVAALVGGPAGLACGLGVTAGAGRYLGRLEPAAVRADRALAAAELPYALELLAAALRAGQPTRRAVEVVADAMDGPVGGRLGRVGRALGLGLPPGRAWLTLADLPGGGRLVAAVVRSVDSGAALSATLTRLADDQRARRAAEVDARAHRAGVLIVLPLGLCFLPAFVFAGVVPVIVAVLGDVLRS
jgi:Flp pilus assembly protein TadB